MFKQKQNILNLLKFQCGRERFNAQRCPLHPVQVLLCPSNFFTGD